MNEIATTNPKEERENWIALVRSFSEEVAGWATEQGWEVAWKSLDRTEESLGAYVVPMLIIQTQHRAVMIEPVARAVLGAVGRIDLYAYPTLFRVMLLRSSKNGGEWLIRTDSGIFLERSWNKETFIRLVDDLTNAG